MLPQLPPQYRSRPATATTADADAIHALVAVCEQELFGRVDTGVDGVLADLSLPTLDPRLDTLLVHDAAGELAARAWVNRGRRSEVDVHPAHREQGLGAALLDWVEARARELGSEWLTQTVADHDRQAAALLRDRGYGPLVTQWQLEIALPIDAAVPEPPSGITVRSFRSGDEQAAYQLTEDAFDEWQVRRKPYDEWARHTIERDTFAPSVSQLAFADDGELVGAVLALDVPELNEGYVERVAVRSDQRNRGIARLLLQSSFRAFHRQGQQACTLWTHSDTGALSLYERIGMTVRRSSTVYSKTW
ncbi:GNAT family N-acetyltransferase [Kitasatospora sp. NPDC093806]|uniref:GNAT family N-acetyltransferase n=1 Tax=Kitasatospora sp. NPDC093806 TaxID=3155075 RepID=UPI00344A7A83